MTELTKNQIRFVEALLNENLTLTQAYIKVYPESEKWKPVNVRARAWRTLQKAHVKRFHDTLQAELRADAQRLGKWNQEQAIERAMFLLEAGRAEIETARRDYEALRASMTEPLKKSDYTALRTARRLSMASVQAMNWAMLQLNKICGVYNDGVQVHGDIVFTGGDQIPD